MRKYLPEVKSVLITPYLLLFVKKQFLCYSAIWLFQNMKLKIVLLLATGFLLLAGTSNVNADCQPIYGGGPVCTLLNPRPTSTPTPILSQTEPSQTTTKGGMTIFPPSQQTENPATGPEMIPLIALLPSGALGFFLRKKTSKLV